MKTNDVFTVGNGISSNIRFNHECMHMHADTHQLLKMEIQ